jgi:hypothetical protein
MSSLNNTAHYFRAAINRFSSAGYTLSSIRAETISPVDINRSILLSPQNQNASRAASMEMPPLRAV